MVIIRPSQRYHRRAMTDTEAAWDAVHEALPAGWTVGPPTYDPGVSGWSVTARTVSAGRGKPPRTVIGTGPDEAAALRDLDDRLLRRPAAGRLADGRTGTTDPAGLPRRSGGTFPRE